MTWETVFVFTLIGNPVVLLVAGLLMVAPGDCGFVNFVRVGTPLLLLSWVITVLLVPLLFSM